MMVAHDVPNESKCINIMTKEELKELRKKKFDEMERNLLKMKKPEDRMFYHHPSEDHIVLSHALTWVMTASIKGRLAKEKSLLLLRQYEEEMLTAYLTEDADFSELLRYCNVLFESMPMVLSALYDLRNDKNARRLGATLIVAGGYGGDIDEDACYDLLDDIDFHFNRPKCRKIESMVPELEGMVLDQMRNFR